MAALQEEKKTMAAAAGAPGASHIDKPLDSATMSREKFVQHQEDPTPMAKQCALDCFAAVCKKHPEALKFRDGYIDPIEQQYPWVYAGERKLGLLACDAKIVAGEHAEELAGTLYAFQTWAASFSEKKGVGSIPHQEFVTRMMKMFIEDDTINPRMTRHGWVKRRPRDVVKIRERCGETELEDLMKCYVIIYEKIMSVAAVVGLTDDSMKSLAHDQGVLSCWVALTRLSEHNPMREVVKECTTNLHERFTDLVNSLLDEDKMRAALAASAPAAASPPSAPSGR